MYNLLTPLAHVRL